MLNTSSIRSIILLTCISKRLSIAALPTSGLIELSTNTHRYITSSSPFSSLQHRRGKSSQQSTFLAQKMATMDSPSAERNKGPIWSVLSEHVLPTIITNNKEDIDDGTPPTTIQVLEIAADAGVHSLFFSEKMKQENIHFQWIPSEPDYACRLSIQERIQSSSNELKSCISSPIQLTLNESGMMEDDCHLLQPSSFGTFHIMTCINMIHISPWSATIGLFKVSSQFLVDGGVLLCYGPYKVNGTAVQSNL